MKKLDEGTDLVLNNLITSINRNGLIEKNGKLFKVVSLSQPACEVLKMHEDEMKIVIKCPNCGKATEFGSTRMISGHVGCDNVIDERGNECYFDDLMLRVLKEREAK